MGNTGKEESIRTYYNWRILVGAAAIIGLIFLLGLRNIEQIKFEEINSDFVFEVLLPFLVIAFLIEVFARIVTNLIYPSAVEPDQKKIVVKNEQEVNKEKFSLLIRVIVSFFIAVFGVNILVHILTEGKLEVIKIFFRGLDILLTTALLASGSSGVKNLIDLIRAIIGGTIQKMKSQK